MKFSVIITSFNSALYLSKAIESFILQEYENKELIIVDGKSTDASHQIISNYQEKFPNIVKWIKDQDNGISHARNIALKHVTGDLIGFLGADDFLHKSFFVEALYYIQQNPNFDIAYFNSYTIGKTNSFDASAKIRMSMRNLIKFCPIASGESFYYRKKVFDDFKFNELNRYSMDYELNMALVRSGKYNFYPVNITAVFNGSFGDSISSSLSKKQRLETIAVQLKYVKNLKERICLLYRRRKLIIRNFRIFIKMIKSI